MRYNKETLEEYCKTNLIIIISELPSKIKRETVLEGKCLKCDKQFKKSFRALIENGGCVSNVHLKMALKK